MWSNLITLAFHSGWETNLGVFMANTKCLKSIPWLCSQGMSLVTNVLPSPSSLTWSTNKYCSCFLVIITHWQYTRKKFGGWGNIMSLQILYSELSLNKRQLETAIALVLLTACHISRVLANLGRHNERPAVVIMPRQKSANLKLPKPPK